GRCAAVPHGRAASAGPAPSRRQLATREGDRSRCLDPLEWSILSNLLTPAECQFSPLLPASRNGERRSQWRMEGPMTYRLESARNGLPILGFCLLLLTLR